jgi:hypothetical protein
VLRRYSLHPCQVPLTCWFRSRGVETVPLYVPLTVVAFGKLPFAYPSALRRHETDADRATNGDPEGGPRSPNAGASEETLSTQSAFVPFPLLIGSA